MSKFKYPFIVLIIISAFSTFWFSARIVHFSSLVANKLDAQPPIIPFFRNLPDSTERNTLQKFIDETSVQVKNLIKLLDVEKPKNRTRVFSTSIRNVDDIRAFNILHRYILDFFPNDFSIVVFYFDKALQQELLQRITNCNVTFGLTRCWLRHVDLSEYSNYIAKNVMYQLYKPLVIRLLLLEYDVVVWLDPGSIPTSRFEPIVTSLVSTGEQLGALFLTATHGLPTSAFTHTDTFRYFGLKPDAFYFHRMISSRFFILARTKSFCLNITNDWLRCCADPDCVWPLGSRSSGCFRQQPEYRYTGCHAGEQSALNIALARLADSSQLVYNSYDASTWFVSAQDWNKTTSELLTTTLAQPIDDGDFDAAE